jgi:23S rRNA pseudouridine955/2504/2580 synthase
MPSATTCSLRSAGRLRPGGANLPAWGIPYQCFNLSARRTAYRPLQASGLQSACTTPAGINLPAQVQGLCGLNSRQINHLHIDAQVKHIIGAKPPSDRTPAAPAARLVEVGEDSAGQRLDNFLIRHLKGVPKTHVYRIIRSGEVRINKGRVNADTRVAAGDVVRLPPVRISDKVAEKAERPAPAREFPILLEDEHLIALDKPAGVAVHGGSGVSFGVIEQLRQARPQARFLELVHRLDRETSGILLVAKKRSALTHLQDQFRERETGKTYLALVTGAWPANKKVIDQPLHKYLQAGPEGTAGAGERRVRVTTADDPEGMRSITLVKVRQVLPARAAQGLPAMSLLEVTIKTGRTHQIRVHLASQGHPIVGDDKYGDFDLNKRLQKQGMRRMFLHAWRLQFTHPATGERVQLSAELPPELADFAPTA